MAHVYDDRFFDWVNKTAIRSAEIVLPLVRDGVDVSSVVDVGCGEGAWLSVWQALGVADLVGVDGAYVEETRLRIAADRFAVADLASPLWLPRRFDLVQSLEVGEHLPPEAAPTLVASLCALGDVVLFSAAQPGQGGEDHVNERRPSYWADLFRGAGYEAFDAIRPRLAGRKDVAPWYRFNTVLYANRAGMGRLSADILSARIARPAELDRAGDFAWTVRRLVLRPLPTSLVSWLSRARYRVACQISMA